MKKLLLIFISVNVVILYGCGKPHRHSSKETESVSIGLPNGIVIGKSTELDVSEKVGEPRYSYEIYNENASKILDYKGLGAVKYVDSKVAAFFRLPKGDEKSLQFWLQRWANKKIQTENIGKRHSSSNDEILEAQLICYEERTTVVYEIQTGIVKRVIFYEK